MCSFTARHINVNWSGQETPLFLMSDVLPVNAMVTTEDETGEINTGIQLWQEVVSSGSDTMFLLMSHHCICWKHLLCTVKSSRVLCCIQKLRFFKARLHCAAVSFCQMWTQESQNRFFFLQPLQKWTIMREGIGISKLKTHINLQICARVWNALCNKLLPSVGQRRYLHWLWHALKRFSEETDCEQRLPSTLPLFNVKNK